MSGYGAIIAEIKKQGDDAITIGEQTDRVDLAAADGRDHRYTYIVRNEASHDMHLSLNRVLIGTLAVFLLGVVTSCTGGNMQPTITAQEAAERLDRYLREAAEAALPSEATLEDRGADSLGCTDPFGKLDGRRTMGASYQVNGLDPAGNNSYFDAMKAWWESHGWTVKNDDRPSDTFMNAENADGFGMSLQSNPQGELFITGSSGCVWPSGTPEPK